MALHCKSAPLAIAQFSCNFAFVKLGENLHIAKLVLFIKVKLYELKPQSGEEVNFPLKINTTQFTFLPLSPQKQSTLTSLGLHSVLKFTSFWKGIIATRGKQEVYNIVIV